MNQKEPFSSFLPSNLIEATLTPPAVPSDPFFRLEPTTLTVNASDAFEIVDVLESFFSCEHISVTKRRAAKFCWCFSAFVDYVWCRCKLWLYSASPETFIVELQRRSGDCCCFMAVFSRLGQVLASAFGFPLAELVPRPLLPASAPGPSLLGPFLDMAGSRDFGLRSEAGCVLWSLADSGSSLNDERVVDALLRLLQEGGFLVQYPAAMAFLGICRHPGGSAFLRATGVSSRLGSVTGDAEMVVKEKVRQLAELLAA